MYTVWKYEIEPDVVNQIYGMPEGAVPISAGLDPYGRLCFWAQVNDKAPKRDHLMSCVGTGWDMGNMFGEAGRYVKFIGSVVKDEYVWHIYDLGEVVEDRLKK
jgi:hypothetical protein